MEVDGINVFCVKSIFWSLLNKKQIMMQKAHMVHCLFYTYVKIIMSTRSCGQCWQQLATSAILPCRPDACLVENKAVSYIRYS